MEEDHTSKNLHHQKCLAGNSAPILEDLLVVVEVVVEARALGGVLNPVVSVLAGTVTMVILLFLTRFTSLYSEL